MNEKIKKACRVITFIMILPVYSAYLLVSFLGDKQRSFPAFSQFLAQFPGLTGIYMRREFYRLTMESCASDSVIGYGSIFAHPNVSLGSGVSIGSYCCFGAVKIEAGTQIASRVSIISGLEQHQRDSSGQLIEGKSEQVIIGKHVWVGEGAIIASNIGDYSNIAAGAVILKVVPSKSSAIGNPAKIVSETLAS